MNYRNVPNTNFLYCSIRKYTHTLITVRERNGFKNPGSQEGIGLLRSSSEKMIQDATKSNRNDAIKINSNLADLFLSNFM